MININYYSEIYKYLYVKKFNLNLYRYPENINAIKKALTRDNKNRKYYLDENSKLCCLLSIENNENYNINTNSNYVALKKSNTY